jgi:hypothetical protein
MTPRKTPSSKPAPSPQPSPRGRGRRKISDRISPLPEEEGRGKLAIESPFSLWERKRVDPDSGGEHGLVLHKKGNAENESTSTTSCSQ